MNSEEQIIVENELMEQEASERLLPFSILTMKTYEANWHHREIANALEAVERGEIKRLMVFMPPRHGKSELGTIRFPAWYLGKHPTHEVITTSYSGDLAVLFGSRTRNIINSPEYQRIFKHIRLDPKSTAKNFWELQELDKEGNIIGANKQGSYSSSGIGGAITGKGANILLIDDPIKNSEEAQSEVIRQKVWDYYTTTLYTRLEKDAAIILILTRWHYDDLAGRLLEAQQKGGEFAEDWKIIDYPAIAEEDEKYRKKDKALWPAKYDYGDLMKIKNTIGLMNWSALYQQQPLISELQEFKPEYFQYFEEDDIVDKSLTIDILIDPALSQKRQADETGFIVRAKIMNKPQWYILDDLSDRYTPTDIIDLIFKQYEKLRKMYPNSNIRVWIESVAYQKSLLYWLEEEQKRRRMYFLVEEIKSTGDKNQRIRGLVPLYKIGIIRHRSWMKNGKLEKQLIQFPQAKYDDRIDGLAFGLQTAEQTADIEEEEEDDNSFNPFSLIQ